MIPNAAWLKMDNWAINRFPSCNEGEVIGRGSVYPCSVAPRKNLPVPTESTVMLEQSGAAEPGISPQDLRTHLVTSGT